MKTDCLNRKLLPERRNRLGSRKVEQLLFLQQNKSKCQQKTKYKKTNNNTISCIVMYIE